MMHLGIDSDKNLKGKNKYGNGKRKRLFAVCLALVMTAGTFAGCGGRPAADADETGVPSGDETGAKTDGQKDRKSVV